MNIDNQNMQNSQASAQTFDVQARKDLIDECSKVAGNYLHLIETKQSLEKNSKLAALKAYSESLIGLLERNPQLNDLVRESMKEQSANLGAQLSSRLNGLGLDFEMLLHSTRLHPDTLDRLFRGQSLPNLSALKTVATKLNGRLHFSFRSLSGESVSSTCIPTQASLDQMGLQISALLNSLRTGLSDKSDFVLLGYRSGSVFDPAYVLSTECLFRKAIARLYDLSINFIPNDETAV